MRPRRHVPGWLLTLLRPFFRRSDGRRAYVLRVVGNDIGPVLKSRDEEPAECAGRFTRDEAPVEQRQ